MVKASDWSIFVGLPKDTHTFNEKPTILIDAEHDVLTNNNIYKSISDKDFYYRNCVASSNIGSSVWYIFNDRRFNGLTSIDELSPNYPNLSLIKKNEVDMVTLDFILDEIFSTNKNKLNFTLFLNQANPIDILNGSLLWLESIQKIYIKDNFFNLQLINKISSFLSNFGYSRYKSEFIWIQNPYSKYIFENIKLKNSIKTLIKEGEDNASHYEAQETKYNKLKALLENERINSNIYQSTISELRQQNQKINYQITEIINKIDKSVKDNL